MCNCFHFFFSFFLLLGPALSLKHLLRLSSLKKKSLFMSRWQKIPPSFGDIKISEHICHPVRGKVGGALLKSQGPTLVQTRLNFALLLEISSQ